jgi:hypothetical protein
MLYGKVYNMCVRICACVSENILLKCFDIVFDHYLCLCVVSERYITEMF